MNKEYRPRYLTGPEVGELYRQALSQAEVLEVNAWLNYIRARDARLALETDLNRITGEELTQVTLAPHTATNGE